MELSREMEYHADEVAVLVTGRQNLISGLKRLEFIESVFGQTLDTLQQMVVEKKKQSLNIYENHSSNMVSVSDYYDLSLENGLPVITNDSLRQHLPQSRVVFKDQWASHPSTEDREAYIAQLDVELDVEDSFVDHTSSWSLFDEPTKAQQQMTNLLYADYGEERKNFTTATPHEFVNFMQESAQKHIISKIYNGFYNKRIYNTIAIEELLKGYVKVEDTSKLFKEIYIDKGSLKVKQVMDIHNDLETLYQIQAKQVSTKYFEFDAKKYHRRDAAKVIEMLQKEVEVKQNEIKAFDKKAFWLNLQLAESVSQASKEEYLDLYRQLFASKEVIDSFETKCVQSFQRVSQNLQTQPTWTEEELSLLNSEMEGMEKRFQAYLKEVHIENMEDYNRESVKPLRNYIEKEMSLFSRLTFSMETVAQMFELVDIGSQLIYGAFNNNLKALTDFQLKLYEEDSVSL